MQKRRGTISFLVVSDIVGDTARAKFAVQSLIDAGFIEDDGSRCRITSAGTEAFEDHKPFLGS